MNREAQYTEKQRLWIGHKARWEGMSRSAVLRDWNPPPDDELCRHGATTCMECKEVLAATVAWIDNEADADD